MNLSSGVNLLVAALRVLQAAILALGVVSRPDVSELDV